MIQLWEGSNCIVIPAGVLASDGTAPHFDVTRNSTMRYYIDFETDRYIGLTCELDEKQTVKFFEWVKSEKQRALTVAVNGVEGQGLVTLSHEGTLDAYLDDTIPQTIEELEAESGYGCWNRDDAALWDNVECLGKFFVNFHYVVSVKIYPESAVPDDMSNDFIRKQQVRYKDLKDREDRGRRMPLCADYLRAAVNICGNNQEGNEDSFADKVGKSIAANLAMDKSRPPKKKRNSYPKKYEDAVEERLKELEDAYDGGDISYGSLEFESKPESIALYLKIKKVKFKNASPPSIAYGVSHSEAIKSRKGMLEQKRGTMPPRVDEVYDQRTRSDSGEYCGVSKIDNRRQIYEEPVKQYLKNLLYRVLFGRITQDKYDLIVKELTPEQVAKKLKKQFKDKSIETIKNGVAGSDAWINRLQILSVTVCDSTQKISIGTNMN